MAISGSPPRREGSNLSDLEMQLVLAVVDEDKPRDVLHANSAPGDEQALEDTSPIIFSLPRPPTPPTELAGLSPAKPFCRVTHVPTLFFNPGTTCAEDPAVLDWKKLAQQYNSLHPDLEAFVHDLEAKKISLNPLETIQTLCAFCVKNNIDQDGFLKILPLYCDIFPGTSNNFARLEVIMRLVTRNYLFAMDDASASACAADKTKQGCMSMKFFTGCLAALKSSGFGKGAELLMAVKKPESLYFEIEKPDGSSVWKKKTNASDSASASAARHADIPKGTYMFVILKSPQSEQYSIRIGKANHVSIANFSKSVTFAGEIIFNEDGEITEINDKSGGYHITGPTKMLAADAQADHLERLGLPSELFRTYSAPPRQMLRLTTVSGPV